jgi:hypothetical protein
MPPDSNCAKKEMVMTRGSLAAAARAISSRRGRLTICVAVAWVAVTLSARPAHAQAVYTYRGNPFSTFSCGPNAEFPSTEVCETPAPTNPYTSYTASNFITITLTLNEALPANTTLCCDQLVTRPGFSVVMNDGQQTIAWEDVEVSVLGITTDAVGRIVAWAVGLGDARLGRWIESCSVFCVDFDRTQLTPNNFAYNIGSRGTWTSSLPGPAAAVGALIDKLSDPALGLKLGQIKSLTDKLNSLLASIESAQYGQAINQLESFINAVTAAENAGRISSETASALISAAQSIIQMLKS